MNDSRLRVVLAQGKPALIVTRWLATHMANAISCFMLNALRNTTQTSTFTLIVLGSRQDCFKMRVVGVGAVKQEHSGTSWFQGGMLSGAGAVKQERSKTSTLDTQRLEMYQNFGMGPIHKDMPFKRYRVLLASKT